jgi:hypothetical protein
MTHSLSGKIELNILNLKGSCLFQKQPAIIKIKNIKEKIMENYIIPLFSKQWETLNENVYFIENIQKKLNSYYNTYKLEELSVYNELLQVVKLFIDNYQKIENYEKHKNTNTQTKEVMSMIFKTIKIRLLPEYEIYDNILGKPDKQLNQKYDESILSTIKEFLGKENCTYSEIKEYLEHFKQLHTNTG